jgi:hypothetical protein
MKKTITAWIIYLGGFAIVMAIDHFLRIQDGNIRTGGIPEALWFLIQITLGVVALRLLFTATKPIITLWKRLLIVGVQAIVCYIITVFLSLYYVVGTGIDSL